MMRKEAAWQTISRLRHPPLPNQLSLALCRHTRHSTIRIVIITIMITIMIITMPPMLVVTIMMIINQVRMMIIQASPDPLVYSHGIIGLANQLVIKPCLTAMPLMKIIIIIIILTPL